MVTKPSAKDEAERGERVGVSAQSYEFPGAVRWRQNVLEQYVADPDNPGENIWWRVPNYPEDIPAATLISLDPAEAIIGDADLTLRCLGTGFIEGATIIFNGGAETTVLVSSTEVTTIVKPSTASVPGSYPVTVKVGTVETEPQMFTFKAAVEDSPLARSQSAPSKAEAQNHKAKSGREKETV
jgi:hypothetical protein